MALYDFYLRITENFRSSPKHFRPALCISQRTLKYHLRSAVLHMPLESDEGYAESCSFSIQCRQFRVCLMPNFIIVVHAAGFRLIWVDA
jgi:hypothetical protein